MELMRWSRARFRVFRALLMRRHRCPAFKGEIVVGESVHETHCRVPLQQSININRRAMIHLLERYHF
jgi:hypothetical protein